MSEELKKNSLSSWLEILQQESWQLELIVSGFAIFLVASVYEPLGDFIQRIRVISNGMESDIFLMLPSVILIGAWGFLLINLIFHVLMRGLWISTIGLRYVSGEIDYEILGFTPRFENYLKKKIKSFDLYIERLERLCSVIFSFTFLIIFSLISFGLYLLFVGLIVYLYRTFLEETLSEKIEGGVRLVIVLFFLITGLLYFIDFLTLGFFKKKKWASKIYYPIYRFYSFITLSNLYRPIYYNLIDSKFGKWVGRLIVPYIFVGMLLASMYANTHAYFPEDADLATMDYESYLDEREEKRVVDDPVIPSKYIQNGFLEIFLPYIPIIDDKALEMICPDFTPFKKIGISQDFIRINRDTTSKEERQLNADTAFQCLQQLYVLSVNDSTYQEVNYKLKEFRDYGERGLFTVLDVSSLGRGEHELKVDKKIRKKIDGEWQLDNRSLSTIPFWIE